MNPNNPNPMEIKGSAVKSIPDFIRKTHPEKYQAWIEALPGTSQEIIQGRHHAVELVSHAGCSGSAHGSAGQDAV